jgi:hypothetical protein
MFAVGDGDAEGGGGGGAYGQDDVPDGNVEVGASFGSGESREESRGETEGV